MQLLKLDILNKAQSTSADHKNGNFIVYIIFSGMHKLMLKILKLRFIIYMLSFLPQKIVSYKDHYPCWETDTSYRKYLLLQYRQI